MPSTKRRAETHSAQSSKRPKSQPTPSNGISPAARIAAKTDGLSNMWIHVKVAMVWRLESKFRVCFEDMSCNGTGQRQFEAIFKGKCVLHWKHLALAVEDQLFLSTQGSSSSPIAVSQHNELKLPFVLSYCDGCIVKFINRTGRGVSNGQIVNLFTIKDNALIDLDLEFAKDTIELPSSPIQTMKREKAVISESSSYKTNNSIMRAASPKETGAHVEPYVEIAAATNIPKETNKERRQREHRERTALKKAGKSKRKENGEEVVQQDQTLAQPPTPRESMNICAPNVGMAEEICPSRTPPSRDVTQPKSDERTDPVELSNLETKPPEDAKPTVTTEDAFAAGWPGYFKLSEVASGRYVGKEVSVIGVVTNSRPITQTSTGSWHKCLALLDPSNASSDSSRYVPGSGFTVNLFTKEYKEWLPDATEGQVLIIKTVKPLNNRGSVLGTVYHDKLKWAMYDQKGSRLVYSELGDTPPSARSHGDKGILNDPFFVPPSPEHELTYCQKLTEWWSSVSAKYQESLGTVHHVGATRASVRQHRLIAETAPDCEPGGYFDCTVELLRNFQNDNGVHTLYVTDYTPNPGLQKDEKAGTVLEDKVFRIEMWDAAASVGPTMVRGGFYSIKNCRMLNKDGYLEGKLKENKITKLEVEEGKSENLTRLLERKAAIETASPATSIRSPHCKIEDTEPDAFFDCSVELLHKYSNKYETFILVTDYTVNNRFLGVTSDEPWAFGLEGRVLKVKVLGDENMKKVQGMPPGSFYQLGRLRYWKSSSMWMCQLKDSGSISRLNSKKVTDQGLKDLLLRKEEWKKSQAKPESPELREPELASNALATSSWKPGSDDFPVIESYPFKFEAIARIVDFYPLTLEAALRLICNECGKELRGLLKACPDCTESMMDDPNVVYRHSLFFMLQDRTGKEIVVTASDPMCSLSKNLDVGSEEAYIKSLSDRLEGFLGNLVSVHESFDQEEIQPETVEARFTLVCWLDSNEEKYGLLDLCSVDNI